MKVRWFGQAAFLLESVGGTTFVTDPYADTIGYPPLRVAADYVTKSHDHDDHANVGAVKGAKRVFDQVGEYQAGDVTVKATLTPHDDVGGTKRGPNLVFTFDDGDIRLCHLGDLGAPLTPEQLASIGKVDVVCVPVGGIYTVDAGGAVKVCDQLKPGLIIPMHYRTETLIYRLAPVEPFINAIGGAEQLPVSDIEVTRESLGAHRRVVVLKHA